LTLAIVFPGAKGYALVSSILNQPPKAAQPGSILGAKKRNFFSCAAGRVG